MTETAGTYAFLCGSAFAAGVMNSVAGGGTLLTFPALTGVVSPAVANATSTVALLPGSFAGALGYRKELTESRRFVLRMLAPSLAGGFLGAWLVGFQFLVAIYGGYFGAGIGILMLAALGFMGVGDIHRMNGVKTFLAAMINTASVIEFVRADLVDWHFAGMMAVSAIVGGYAGARVARRMPPAVVRWSAIGIGFGLAIYYFVR